MLILHGLSVLSQFGCAPLEHFPALHQNGSLRVCDHIRTVHLHQIWFEPETGLTGTGAADHQHIFVSGGLWVLGAAVHGQAFGFCENDIVLEHRVDVGSNILTGSPTGRAILHAVTVLLGVFTFEIHRQTQASTAAQPHQQIQRVQAGPETLQRPRQDSKQGKEFLRSICPLSQSPCLPEVGSKQPHQEIGKVQQNELFDVKLLFHRSSSFRLVRSTTAFLTISLN